jgi:hypothetical protein
LYDIKTRRISFEVALFYQNDSWPKAYFTADQGQRPWNYRYRSIYWPKVIFTFLRIVAVNMAFGQRIQIVYPTRGDAPGQR